MKNELVKKKKKKKPKHKPNKKKAHVTPKTKVKIHGRLGEDYLLI